MQQLRDKLNNNSVPPPEGVWEDISTKLDAEHPGMTSPKKVNRIYYLFAAAATLIVVVAGYMLFTIFSNPGEKQVVSSTDSLQVKNNDLAKNEPAQTKRVDESLMRVPDKELSNTVKSKERLIVSNKSSNPQKTVITEKKDNAIIKNNSDTSTVSSVEQKTDYITIAGPEGQPVKVSAKAAALIESSDEKIPPHTVWNKKIDKWRDIMKTNTLAPTPGNFLDIVELNNALVDKK
jgi:hypothetical protein